MAFMCEYIMCTIYTICYIVLNMYVLCMSLCIAKFLCMRVSVYFLRLFCMSSHFFCMCA